ncbi:alternative ribosome rescue aminoacyl-tRNA hydrolase ArfB [Denitrobaculum tricleocarpae]|uniref:Aminoacyl-tRNA hydrolase n=1 Tax=Denitrobaculum tricleocarpae TaxID=2591009 RepID=A0A545T3Z5_9PROT|nr:alternative ribosome rescue aminoacyl-tRNA hydrolase ArfB [Denitrobaculum tricleocarpae]TQV71953.1 aminoacyl-tRNA hydrolase [Denitrobaculum tricleocarpae]
MIEITERIHLDPSEVEETFVRASGPGGQNVNKVSTAVQLRFDLRHSPSLPAYVRERAQQLAGKRLSKDGVLVLTAARFRTQERNREDAVARLVELLREACERPAYRRPTRPTRASKQRRMDSKTKRGSIKKLRSRKFDD